MESNDRSDWSVNLTHKPDYTAWFCWALTGIALVLQPLIAWWLVQA
ncbi:MAG: hypothetical protein Q7P63_09955 [Verrucomicrobiota bacterium JB022]|nr:hypothetical protein [Verrucomicrobiota bacterium JB022]